MISTRELAAAAWKNVTSALFVKSRAYAELHADRWLILSARYGLVDPEDVIEPYEQTLSNASAATRRTWAAHVYAQLERAGALGPGTRFLWLAGQKYQQDLRRILRAHEHLDPLAGKPIGERLSWLNRSFDGTLSRTRGTSS